MEFRKDVVQNISWMYIYRLVRLPLAFIVTAWLARFLGPGNYGVYVYAIAIAELLMLFWSQGFKEVVIQEIRRSGLEKTEVSIAAFQLMAVGSFVLYGVLGGVLLLFIDEQVVKIISLLCGLGICFRAFEGFELWFHADLNVRVTIGVQFVAQLLFILIIAVLIYHDASLMWFGFAYAIQLIIAGIGFVVVYWLEKKSIAFFKKLQPIRKKLLKLGKFMILAKLCFTASVLIDRIIIEHLIDAEAVGYYAAAMKLITTWTFISASISLSFIPIISDAENEKERQQNMQRMFGWISTAALLLVVPFYMFAGFLIPIIFGEGYSESISLFRILSLSLPFFLLNEGVKVWLLTYHKSRYYIVSMILTTVLCITGNYLLIPVMGVEGASFAFLFSWMIGSVFVFFVFKETRHLGRQLLKSFLYPIVIVKNIRR
jgi:PST family polysaccharide transporter